MSVNFSVLDEGSFGVHGPPNSLSPKIMVQNCRERGEGPEKMPLQEEGNTVSKSDA